MITIITYQYLKSAHILKTVLQFRNNPQWVESFDLLVQWV